MSQRYQAGFITASYNGLLAPDAPTINTVTTSANSAIVTFIAPTNVGGSNITSFTVSSNTGISSSNASSPITISGLSLDTPYTFTVTATNAYGVSPVSAASSSVTPSIYGTNFYLVQAGGGGGGRNDGGGDGGAGGLVIYDNFTFTARSYTVSIGAGGATHTVGTDSTFAHAATSTASGGGKGGDNSEDTAGILSGGCVGSAGATGGAFSTGTVTQANPSGGGVGYGNVQGALAYSPYRVGGGGGTATAGQSGSVNQYGSGNGGDGKEWPTGSSNYYGGGGGGGQHSSAPFAGAGGIGGGGAGGTYAGQNGTAGTSNTGGGGGGSGPLSGYQGGAGGSGVVVVCYPSTFTASQSGLTMTTTTVGTKKVTTITAGTGTFTLS